MNKLRDRDNKMDRLPVKVLPVLKRKFHKQSVVLPLFFPRTKYFSNPKPMLSFGLLLFPPLYQQTNKCKLTAEQQSSVYSCHFKTYASD